MLDSHVTFHLAQLFKFYNFKQSNLLASKSILTLIQFVLLARIFDRLNTQI